MNMTKEQFCKLVESVLEKHTIEMEGYSYYSSNPGVSKRDYDIVAEDLWNTFLTGGDVGWCERGNHCCCGGDLPEIQRTCSSWVEPQ